MRVLHINASYKPAFVYGGPTMSVSMLCEQLAKHGHEVTVFTTTANGTTELIVAPGIPLDVDGVAVTYFKRVSKDHTHFSPGLLIKLWKEAKNFDLIHIHAWWNLVSVLACFIAIKRKVPVIVSPRGTLSSYSFATNNIKIKKNIHRFLGKPILEKSHIHVTTQQEQTAILKLIKPKSIHIIPNLVKLPMCEEPKKQETEPYLKMIFLSRIEAKKGLDILFSALPQVTVPYHLTIAGDGEQEYIDHLKNLAEDKNITGYITWAGFQGENKFELLRNHDLFVLPSYDENFGNSVIESLAGGTPVLISANVGLADYVTTNQLGWTCDITASSISEAINHIGTIDKEKLEAIRQRAPTAIYDDFDAAKLAKKYLTLYNQII